MSDVLLEQSQKPSKKKDALYGKVFNVQWKSWILFLRTYT